MSNAWTAIILSWMYIKRKLFIFTPIMPQRHWKEEEIIDKKLINEFDEFPNVSIETIFSAFSLFLSRHSEQKCFSYSRAFFLFIKRASMEKSKCNVSTVVAKNERGKSWCVCGFSGMLFECIPEWLLLSENREDKINYINFSS